MTGQPATSPASTAAAGDEVSLPREQLGERWHGRVTAVDGADAVVAWRAYDTKTGRRRPMRHKSRVTAADLEPAPRRILIKTVTRLAWDEGRHRRGWHGEFADGGSSSGFRPMRGFAELPWHQDGDVLHYHGSLGIDRGDMAQISGTIAGRYAPSAEMIPKFLDRLKAGNVKVTHERVPPSSLKPTQTTGAAGTVRRIADEIAGGKDTKPVLVSADDRVIDGHHQWAAHLLADSEGRRDAAGVPAGAPVIRVHLPADDVLKEARQFAAEQGIENRKTGVAANPAYAAKPAVDVRGWVKEGTAGLDETVRKANADRARTGVLKRAQRQQGSIGGGFAVAGGSSDIARPVADALTRATRTGKEHYVIPTALGMAASATKTTNSGYIRVRPDGEVTDWQRPEGTWDPHRQVATMSDHTVSGILDAQLSKTRTAAAPSPKPAKKNPDAQWSRSAIARAIKDVDKTPELQRPEFYQRIRDVAAASGHADLIPAGWGQGRKSAATPSQRGVGVETETKLFDSGRHPRDQHGQWINVGHVVHLADGSTGRVTGTGHGGKIEVETHGGKHVEVAANQVSVHGPAGPPPGHRARGGFRQFTPQHAPLTAAPVARTPTSQHDEGATTAKPSLEVGKIYYGATGNRGRSAYLIDKVVGPIPDGRVEVVARRHYPSTGKTDATPKTSYLPATAQQYVGTGNRAKADAPGRSPAEKTDGKPLSDAEYQAHTEHVEAKLKDAIDAGKATDRAHTLDPAGEVWSPERAAVHKEIVDKMLADAAHVPNEGKGLIAGGLGGAGKSTVLGKHHDIDTSQYMTINPDDIKEELAARGLIPHVEGLTPMEASALVHEESSRVANMAAQRAYQQKKNLIWDITMSSAKSAGKRITDMRQAGYGDMRGMFVDIPAETSAQRALGRHRRGLELYRQGQGYGGRYVPPALIRKSAGEGPVSTNRQAFEQLHGKFDGWSMYDNSSHAGPPELVGAGGLDAHRNRKGS